MNATGPYGQGPGQYPYRPSSAPNVPPPPGRPIPQPPPYPSNSGYSPNSIRAPYGPSSNTPRPPAPGGGRNGGLIAAIVAVVALLLAALGVGGWFLLQGNSADESARPPTTANPIPSASAEVTPRATMPSRSTSSASVAPPSNAQICPAAFGPVGEYVSSAAGTTITSCPFAEAVRVAYAGGGQAGAARTVNATSPVTGRSYAMNCSPVGGLITCTGGDNAVVYVY